jgi:nitrogen-specific signal transduction histidine kinase
MHQMRSPLSALRTFGKLLNRRLQREGGLNLELAQNIMAQSDRIAELLNPFTAGIYVYITIPDRHG